MSNTEFKVIPDHEAVDMLRIWKSKGHDPVSTFRFFGALGKGVFAGIEDYVGDGWVLIPASMDVGVYDTYAELYAALGGLLDELYAPQA